MISVTLTSTLNTGLPHFLFLFFFFLEYIGNNESKQSLKLYSLQLKKISRLVKSTCWHVHNVCSTHIDSRITELTKQHHCLPELAWVKSSEFRNSSYLEAGKGNICIHQLSKQLCFPSVLKNSLQNHCLRNSLFSEDDNGLASLGVKTVLFKAW